MTEKQKQLVPVFTFFIILSGALVPLCHYAFAIGVFLCSVYLGIYVGICRKANNQSGEYSGEEKK